MALNVGLRAVPNDRIVDAYVELTLADAKVARLKARVAALGDCREVGRRPDAHQFPPRGEGAPAATSTAGLAAPAQRGVL